MAFGGLLTGLGNLRSHGDSFGQIGISALYLLGWLLALGAFALIILWNAAPSRSEVRDMTGHIEAALCTQDAAET